MVGVDMDDRVKEAIAALGEVVSMSVESNYNVDHLDTNKTVEDNGDQKVDLYLASHGKTRRTGGPYMDDIQREEAEIRRAKMEDREPDLDNPPADVATKLVPKSQLVETDTDKSHISDTLEVENDPVDSYVVPAPVNEPDPTQANWDNDSSKVAALEGAQRYQELVEKNQNRPASETVKTEDDGVPPSQEVPSFNSPTETHEGDNV